MRQIPQDLRYALRLLARTPGFGTQILRPHNGHLC